MIKILKGRLKDFISFEGRAQYARGYGHYFIKRRFSEELTGAGLGYYWTVENITRSPDIHTWYRSGASIHD